MDFDERQRVTQQLWQECQKAHSTYFRARKIAIAEAEEPLEPLKAASEAAVAAYKASLTDLMGRDRPLTAEAGLTQAVRTRTLARKDWHAACIKLSRTGTKTEAVSCIRNVWSKAGKRYDQACDEVKRLEAELEKRALKERQDDN